MKRVTICGAGLIGSSIAWRLAQAGFHVTLADSGSFGGETSSAGAGMLSPGGEFDEPSIWSDLGLESMSLYPDFVDELRARTKLPIDFQICGCTKFAEGMFDAVRGPERHFPGDGLVDPNHLLRALRAACVERGVSILENYPLTSVRAEDHGAFVVAAGAWSNQIQITFRDRQLELPPVKPIKGHLIGFDLAAGSKLPGDPNGAEKLGVLRLGPMLRRGHAYVLQRASGFTIAGSTEEDAGFDRTIDPEICRDIHARGAALWPPLKDMQPSKCWIGFRPFSETPRIGRFQDSNVFLAYGHFRNGILLAPLTAQRIAGAVCAAL